jgi:pimeloyl-ACP methyl ester carboxylesterase
VTGDPSTFPNQTVARPRGKFRWRRWFWLGWVGVLLLGWMIWSWWGESNPEQERQLRIRVHQHLQEWFPEQMALSQDQYGFLPRTPQASEAGRPDVVLLHGLDEPGDIWDDLVPVLAEAGWVAWEFRYPNDQAIAASADFLAEAWLELPEDLSVVLIGHSMGGLVARDFVGRWRHPVDAEPQVSGASVHGVILVGTPNQGSEWARLRVWLELRDFLATPPQQQLALFHGLRDGTGAAKIDLRPGSAFLTGLNARAWPTEVPIRIIGGQLVEPTPRMSQSMEMIAKESGTNETTIALEAWWASLGEGLGDGVVSMQSLAITSAPPPKIVPASHRGLVARTLQSREEPPAIPIIREILDGWIHRKDR